MPAIARYFLVGVAIVGGLPAYLLLEWAHALPPSISDRPWPLELLVAIALLALALLASVETQHRRRMTTSVFALAAAASLGLLVVVGHVTHHALPDGPAELRIGQTLPDVTLPDEHGRPTSLRSLRGQPLVLVYYRGGWCPSCRRQLTALAPVAMPYLEAGVHIIGISPDPPDVAARFRDELGLPFPLLSDEAQNLGAALCGRSTHCELVVDRAGIVRWGALNDNWRVAARPAAVLQAAYRVK